MHRLGRGTSGLLLFARTPEARRAVAADWRAGRVEKTYRALVSGVPRESRFSVAAPIGLVSHPRLGRVHAAEASGKAVAVPRRGARRTGRPGARGGPHRDGAAAPDPHPPRLRGAPARRRSALRQRRSAGAGALHSPATAATASTPTGSRSRTRRPARGSSSSASRLPTCARREARDERFLLRFGQALEAMLLAQRRAPGPHAARPHEPHGQPGARVAGRGQPAACTRRRAATSFAAPL